MADDFLSQLDQIAKDKAERDQNILNEQQRQKAAEAKRIADQKTGDDAVRETLANVVDTYIRPPLEALKPRFGGEIKEQKGGGEGYDIFHAIVWKTGNEPLQTSAVEVEVQKARISFTHNGKPGPSVSVKITGRKDGQTAVERSNTVEIENASMLKTLVERHILEAVRHVLN